MAETIKKIITPDGKILRKIFENTKSYHIDIYQREYKWKKEQVLTLLDDIEIRFLQSNRKETEPDKINKDVLENFEPYFLNTFLTHTTSDDISIVDGQQRLTTFLLVFINIHRIIEKISEATEKPQHKTYALQTIADLIFEKDDFGNVKQGKFKIYNENREQVFKSLIYNAEYTPKDETQKRIIENFELINEYFKKFISTENQEVLYDIPKLTYYISYLLNKLTIVEIIIEQKENVATVFEVVNDRGLGLKPYEILKGKLIGNLENSRKEEANSVWTALQNNYYNSNIKNSKDKTIDLDDFFKAFFRAKFANSETDYEKYEDKYHYEVYRNNDIKKYFGNFENNDTLYSRVTKDIKYFAELYLSIRTTYQYEHLVYNKLLDQNQQYLLILSNILLDDCHKNEKIVSISKKFDQFHTTLRLIDKYDSNVFQNFIYELNKKLRDKPITYIWNIFDKIFVDYLEKDEFIEKGKYTTINQIYEWDRFQNMHNRWLNFTKYILMRIDRTLAEILDKPSYASEHLEELEERFNKNNRKRYGMHLEHIYAFNNANKQLFLDSNGNYDERLFIEVRNRLGAVLLLKDKQNISSGNDKYKKKFKTYEKSNLIWNELLVGHIPDVDKKHLPDITPFEKQLPCEKGLFPLNGVSIRQKELFEMVKFIWCNSLPTPTPPDGLTAGRDFEIW